MQKVIDNSFVLLLPIFFSLTTVGTYTWLRKFFNYSYELGSMINYTFIIEIRANIMAKVKYCKFKIWYFFTNLISILTFGLFLYYLIENNQLPISYSGDLFLVIIVIFIASVTNILIGPVTAWGSLLLQEKSLLNIALIKLILFTIFMAMCLYLSLIFLGINGILCIIIGAKFNIY